MLTSTQRKNELENLTRVAIEELFSSNKFKATRSINGTSYNIKNNKVEASFYVNEKLAYNGQVKVDNQSSTVVEGTMQDVLKSAKKIVNIYNSFV